MTRRSRGSDDTMENWIAGQIFHEALPPLAVPESTLRFDGKRCFHVRQLFKRHNLDPHNLRHWHVLIWILAGSPKRRSLEWEPRKLLWLRFAVDSVKRADPKKTDTEICKELSKSRQWGGIRAGTLRRKLQDARNPAYESGYQRFCKQCAARQTSYR
jgi:hypothetical protein